MLRLIEVNEENKIAEEHYQYKMKTNANVAIGLIKSYLMKSVMIMDRKEAKKFSKSTQK